MMDSRREFYIFQSSSFMMGRELQFAAQISVPIHFNVSQCICQIASTHRGSIQNYFKATIAAQCRTFVLINLSFSTSNRI